MKTISFCTTVLLLLLTAPAHAHEKGNGGDALVCQPSATTGIRSKPHLRVLDSVLLEKFPPFRFRAFSDTKTAIAAMVAHLRSNLPKLGEELVRFVETYEKRADLERGVYWISGIPKDVKDEDLHVEMPKNCNPDPVQVVLRVPYQPMRYFYNPDIIQALMQDSDELSWLLVHEWLRDYLGDADVIRLLNGYFHSEEFFSADEEAMKQTLVRTGLLDKVGPLASALRRELATREPFIAKAEATLAEAEKMMAEDWGDKSAAERSAGKKKLHPLFNSLLELRRDIYFNNRPALPRDFIARVNRLQRGIESFLGFYHSL